MHFPPGGSPLAGDLLRLGDAVAAQGDWSGVFVVSRDELLGLAAIEIGERRRSSGPARRPPGATRCGVWIERAALRRGSEPEGREVTIAADEVDADDGAER